MLFLVEFPGSGVSRCLFAVLFSFWVSLISLLAILTLLSFHGRCEGRILRMQMEW